MPTSKRIIEGTWTCSSCGTQGIKGRHKVCPSCGNAREDEEMSFDFGAKNADGSVQAETVEGADLKALAEAGADWSCAACGSGNRGDASTCTQCGAEKASTEKASTEKDPAPPPPPEGEPFDPKTGAVIGTSGLLILGAAALCFMVCCGICCWWTGPKEVQAQVSERTYFRQVSVTRLKPFPRQAWKDKLPSPASPPGSANLSPGLGDIQSCKTQTCYARPPTGGRLIEVSGRSWSRTHSVRPMTSRSDSGWRHEVPSGHGSWPSGGDGGHEGIEGTPSCHRKEKVAKKCRQERRKEKCGSEQRCTTKDLGNGFAEEVCDSVPKYCTTYEEVCDPAQYADWCTWTELKWGMSRSESTKGQLNKPYWPNLSAGYREALSKSQSNQIHVQILAGSGKHSISVKGKRLMSYQVGQQYFHGAALTPVPPSLQRKGPGPFRDCGADIPADQLITRDECDYTSWEWVDEAPLTAQDVQRPDWPASDLGNDGKSTQTEWAEVEMSWARGDKNDSEKVLVTPKEADEWPIGREVPIMVRYGGELDEKLGDWPVPSPKPHPSE